jgi:hypothetical protein
MVYSWHGGASGGGQVLGCGGRLRIWRRDGHVTVGETGSGPAHVRSICAPHAASLGHESSTTTMQSYVKPEAASGAQQKRVMTVLDGGRLAS